MDICRNISVINLHHSNEAIIFDYYEDILDIIRVISNKSLSFLKQNTRTMDSVEIYDSQELNININGLLYLYIIYKICSEV